MPTEKAILGQSGEALAARFLVKADYRILSRNFHSRYGEADIVARDKNQKIVFVEVKTRSNRFFGLPAEAVDARKFYKIYRTAMHFFATQNPPPPLSWRIDVIAVELRQGNRPKLIHYKNVFNGS